MLAPAYVICAFEPVSGALCMQALGRGVRDPAVEAVGMLIAAYTTDLHKKIVRNVEPKNMIKILLVEDSAA